MQFSVLMSVYYKENAEYFDLSLKSILKQQTKAPDEFVLVCDGELSDELNEVIAKYEAEYKEAFKVCRLPKNEGLGNALNFGLKECSFELIARADSDDICEETRFEEQLRLFENDDDLAVVGSDIDEFKIDPNKPFRYKRMPVEHKAIYNMCKFRNPINHMTAMFKKSAIESVGSYLNLKFLEDYYLWIRVLAKGYKFQNIPKPLVHARVGNGMIERRSDHVCIDGWQTISSFMLKAKMINVFEYIRNIISVRGFIYAPPKVKAFFYKTILRSRKR